MGDLLTVLALGVAIGAVLGGMGGGGAILTVPALVYVVGQSAQDATTSSLVIVGLTAAVGVASYLTTHRVRWRIGLTFGLVGIPATWLGGFLNHHVEEHLLLLGFAVLMLVAAGAMVADDQSQHATDRDCRKRSASRRGADSEHSPRSRRADHDDAGSVAVLDRTTIAETPLHVSLTATVAVALCVGLLTGFFGVGGGFVVVPALVLVLRLPMQYAVGTSLLIVALNSGTSLATRIPTAHVDWSVIVPFTLAAMTATLAGKRVADRLPARRLKLGFAALLVLVAGYTAAQNVGPLVGHDPGPTTASPESTIDRDASPATVMAPADVVEAVGAGAGIIDVRTQAEFAEGHLDGALNIDVTAPSFVDRISVLDHDRAWVVYCASGNRAGGAVEQMVDAGFTDVQNGGGYQGLAEVVDDLGGSIR